MQIEHLVTQQWGPLNPPTLTFRNNHSAQIVIWGPTSQPSPAFPGNAELPHGHHMVKPPSKASSDYQQGNRTSLCILFQNVHHIVQQTTTILEAHQKTHDVFVILELWYGRLRAMGPDTQFVVATQGTQVGSPGCSPENHDRNHHDQLPMVLDILDSKALQRNPQEYADALPTCNWCTPQHDPNSHFLYGTQSHPNWVLLETQVDACIAIYVNKCITRGTPKLLSKFSMRDTALLSLALGDTHYHILGLYNNKHNTAIDFLFNHINHLPHVHICRGDYNLHSPLWDSILGVESPQTHLALVFALHRAMGHTLASPLNVITHIPDNICNRATIINLVWADSDIHTQVKVDATGHGLSDHALIKATLDTPEWTTLGLPTIARNSEAETDLLQTLANELLSLLPSE